jgi:hypothetical protein
LKLRKNSISNLTNDQVKGVTIGTLTTVDPIATINLPTSGCTSFIDAYPTAWCPPIINPKECIYTW